MLCPVCATEMNGSNKCPFCGHVCTHEEDNVVRLNGEIISTGHRNHWCQTTNDPHLAGKVVDGTHYHPQDSYVNTSSVEGQAAAGAQTPDPNMKGLLENVSLHPDMIPYHLNQGTPEQEIAYDTWSGMHMEMPKNSPQRREMDKAVKWIIIFFVVGVFGLPFLIFVIVWFGMLFGQLAP